MIDRRELLRWICTIVLVLQWASGGCVVKAAGPFAELIGSGSSEESHANDENNLVLQRTRSPVNLTQLEMIDNDVELFHRAMERKLVRYGGDKSLADGSDDVDEELIKKASPGLFARITRAAKDIVAPAKSYYDLINRYRYWRTEWNRLQKELGTRPGGKQPVLRDSLDVLRLEYAKVDYELAREICSPSTGTQNGKRPSNAEDLDFMVKIIRRLIERLEDKLARLEDKSPSEILAEDLGDDQEAEKNIQELELRVLAASNRAKRIAARSLANLAAQEFLSVVRLLAFDSLATFVVNRNANKASAADTMSALMSRMEPIVLLLGSANSHLLVSYLRDVQFRATLNLINHSFNMLSCPRSADGHKQMEHIT